MPPLSMTTTSSDYDDDNNSNNDRDMNSTMMSSHHQQQQQQHDLRQAPSSPRGIILTSSSHHKDSCISKHNSNRRTVVRFNLQATQIHKHQFDHHRNSNSNSNLWWSPKELQVIENQCKLLLHNSNNNNNSSSHSLRGLECYRTDRMKQIQQSWYNCVQAVLDEQALQRHDQSYDDELLAQICSQTTSISTRHARYMGLSDQAQLEQQQQQQQHKQFRFMETVRVRKIPTLASYTQQECQSMWYSLQEMQHMKADRTVMARKLKDNNYKETDQLCIRGLECVYVSHATRRRQSKWRGIDAVLDTQEQVPCTEERVAMKYRLETRHCAKEARERGASDAKAVLAQL